ncbi:MAG: radical SAM family heme chaperone HemW [Spirochaetota bacterium]
MNLGLYIHFPFCRRKCSYCSFYSVPVDENDRNDETGIINKYLKALLSEIEKRSTELRDFEIDTIYLGGGSPSLLTSIQLNKIFSQIKKSLKLKDEKLEITIECNPDDFSVNKIGEYKSVGINRVVLGVQTFNKRLHSILGRSACLCNDKMLSEFISFPDIVYCVDIIIGIPGQSERDLREELKKIVGYGIEHVSAYTLSIDAGTPLAKSGLQVKNLNNMQRIFLERTMDFFTNAGYNHYEVSNYALPDFESKHNLKYWKFMPYAGFGAGAHSFYNNERFYNPASIEEYIKMNGNIREKDKRTKNSEIVEYILSGMRLAEGISVKDFESKLGIGLSKELMSKFIDLQKKNLLEIEEFDNDMKVKFSRQGFFQMDGLIYEMTEMFL